MADSKATIEYDENGHITKVSYSNGCYYEFDADGHITHGYMPTQGIEWTSEAKDGWWFKWHGLVNRK